MKIWRQANSSLMKMEHWWQWRLVSTYHIVLFLTLSLPNVAKGKIQQKIPNFILWNLEKQVAPCVSTGRELSFEWSHHRVSSTDSKVRTTLQNSIIHSGSERVKQHCRQYLVLLEYYPVYKAASHSSLFLGESWKTLTAKESNERELYFRLGIDRKEVN